MGLILMFSKRLRHKKLTQQLCANRERLYKLAYSWCGDAMLADDLVQDAMQKALASFDSLKDDSKLNAWTCRIMLNLFRDCIRRNKETVDIDDVQLFSETDPQQHLASLDSAQLLRYCLQKLGEKHRNVITMVDLMGFTYEEVSMALEIPIGTVMSRLCRGRSLLRQLLENNQQNHATTATNNLRRVK